VSEEGPVGMNLTDTLNMQRESPIQSK